MAKPFNMLVTVRTPKRQWVQFSLAIMFVVVTLLCVWLAIHMRAVNRQRAAVMAIPFPSADRNGYRNVLAEIR